MKKSEQLSINERVMRALDEATPEIDQAIKDGLVFWHLLNNCNAKYFSTQGHYIVLMSYKTVVAVIDTSDNSNWVCYDFSRFVYGYTATTSMHISKFAKKFGATVLSWKQV